MSLHGVPSGSWGKVKKLHESPHHYVWVETSDFLEWTVALGKSTRPGGLHTHWIVQTDIAPDNESVSIATLSCATRDDEMVDVDAHDLLRTELFRTIATGQSADDEMEMTRVSLLQKQPFTVPPPSAEAFDFSFRVTASESAISTELSKLGMPVVADAGCSITWPLGTSAQAATDYVQVTVSEGSVQGTARISSPEPSSRRLAHADLIAVLNRLHFLLKRVDETASFSGPTGLLDQ